VVTLTARTRGKVQVVGEAAVELMTMTTMTTPLTTLATRRGQDRGHGQGQGQGQGRGRGRGPAPAPSILFVMASLSPMMGLRTSPLTTTAVVGQAYNTYYSTRFDPNDHHPHHHSPTPPALTHKPGYR
jgi:hypothetical protein